MMTYQTSEIKSAKLQTNSTHYANQPLNDQTPKQLNN